MLYGTCFEKEERGSYRGYRNSPKLRVVKYRLLHERRAPLKGRRVSQANRREGEQRGKRISGRRDGLFKVSECVAHSRNL